MFALRRECADRLYLTSYCNELFSCRKKYDSLGYSWKRRKSTPNRTEVWETRYERSKALFALHRSNLKTGVSLWKRIKCFPFTLRGIIFENAAIAGHFGFVFEEDSGREITWSPWCHRVSFSNGFLSTLKRKPGVFKFLWFEERFRKAPFSWRISVDGRPDRRKRAGFSNFFVAACSCMQARQLIVSNIFMFVSDWQTTFRFFRFKMIALRW